MKRIAIIIIAAALFAVPAYAMTRTAEINTATGQVVAIVNNIVTTVAPAGMTFMTITDDTVQAGWYYSFTTHTFAATPH